MVHGDPLGAEDRKGVAEAGGALDVALGKNGLAPVVELDDEIGLRADPRPGRSLALLGNYDVTLRSGNDAPMDVKRLL